jgi:hypothetical protein
MIRIVHYGILSTKEEGQANLLTPALYIITAITILWLVNCDRLKGIFSSGLLFIFWLLVSLAMMPDMIDSSVTFYREVSPLDEYFRVTDNHLYRSKQSHCGQNFLAFGVISCLRLVH